MKIMKTLTALFIVALMCCSCSMSHENTLEANDSVDANQEIITPVTDNNWVRDHLPDCNSRKMVLQPLEYSEWYVIGFTDCEHGDPTSRDYIKERVVKEIYICDSCGFTTVNSYTEASVVHPQ